MELEQALAFINTAVEPQIGRSLSEAEIALLQGAWDGETYLQIAERVGYSVNYLQRDVGPRFWKLLSSTFDRRLNKTNLAQVLPTLQMPSHQVSVAQAVSVPAAAHDSSPSACPSIDWGEAPNVQFFYGRTEEIGQLQQWIVEHKAHLVAVLGMGGIGKTTLVAKAIEAMQGKFERVIWRSLRNAPSLATLLQELVPFLSQQPDTDSSLPQLMHWLRERRCLLVLDNVETILKGGERAGQMREGYDNYGELLRLVGQSRHQSCLVITSREKPAEVSLIEGGTVQQMVLSGSREAALALLDAKQLSGSQEHKEQLCDRYSDSPLALKIVSSSVRDVFAGDIAQFLAEDTLFFNGTRQLLDSQFARLTELEQTVMRWLAINRDWTGIAELAADIEPPCSKMALLEALESLCWRSLIERRGSAYTQQPVIMEYVTDGLIEQVGAELTQLDAFEEAVYKTSALRRFALLKTTVRDFVRGIQKRLILGPIAERIGPSDSHRYIRNQLKALRSLDKALIGYGAGNLINLGCALSMDFTGLDLSVLAIRQADLQQATLHYVDLTDTTVQETLFKQPIGPLLRVVYSPDGTLLATAGGGGKIVVWQTSDYRPKLTLQASTNRILSLDFSPDGAFLVSEGTDHELNVWDMATGQRSTTLKGHSGPVWAIRFSPTENVFVSASVDFTLLLWDLNHRQPIHRLEGHTRQVNAVAFSPDGHQIASGSSDETLRLWDRHTGQLLEVWSCETTPLSIGFSPDGKCLAIGHTDGTIRFWELTSEQALLTLQAHDCWAFSVCFSPCGRYLASGGRGRTAKLWDTRTGELLWAAATDSRWTYSVAFSRDRVATPGGLGQRLAAINSDNTLRIWDISQKQLLRSLQGYSSWVMSLDAHPEQTSLVSASNDWSIRLWNTKTGALLKTLSGHTDWVQVVIFSPDGQRIASGGSDCTVRLWDSETGALVQVLPGHDATVWTLFFSSDGERLLSGGSDQAIKLWNAKTGQLIWSIAHNDRVLDARFSPDNQRIASAGVGNAIYLWDAQTGALQQTWQVQQNYSDAIAFSPVPVATPEGFGNYLAAAGGGGTNSISLLNLQTGAIYGSLEDNQANVRAIAFSPDGKLIAGGGDDHNVSLWNVATGQLLVALKGHEGRINAIAFMADGQTLASGSTDETIRLWDVASGRCLRILHAPRPYEDMNIAGIQGLTEAQKASLTALGAVEG
ncbi:MAG: NB-ARC domain-containing protein [Elainellaceae cyanobacterium]